MILFSTMLMVVLAWVTLSAGVDEVLPGTKPINMKGDMASQMVAGVDRFLLQEIDASVKHRAKYWQRDFSSENNYTKSIEPNRKRLAYILGVRDSRVPFDGLEVVGTFEFLHKHLNWPKR